MGRCTFSTCAWLHGASAMSIYIISSPAPATRRGRCWPSRGRCGRRVDCRVGARRRLSEKRRSTAPLIETEHGQDGDRESSVSALNVLAVLCSTAHAIAHADARAALGAVPNSVSGIFLARTLLPAAAYRRRALEKGAPSSRLRRAASEGMRRGT